jgi:hypothetical protein
MVALWAGPEAGSRWSARSKARTYDLDAGEDRPILLTGGNGIPAKLSAPGQARLHRVDLLIATQKCHESLGEPGL